VNVLSFSLWGQRPKYLTGMIRNAELSPRIYPGWQCRVYCGRSVPADAMARLAAMPHVTTIAMPHDGDWTGLFWRFIAAGDAAADAVVFRDADSRLTARERGAVDEWVASGRAVHVMRDHPEHTAPILGGMWGIRRGAATSIGELMDAFPKTDRWQTDQDFLAERVWPLVRADAVEHDEYFARRSFPTPRVGRTFVGQPFDEHDRAEIEGPTATERRARQMAQRILEAVGARPPLPRF
jgi:hypothetical protein